MARVKVEHSTDPDTDQEFLNWDIDATGITKETLSEITDQLEEEHGILVPVLLGRLGIYRLLGQQGDCHV